jgi:regulator of protease activity HflC (stomatin/prohibitin superfamily)
MKTKIYLMMLFSVAIMSMSCSRVDPGYVGVKIKTLGQNKGVEPVVLGVGRYWMGPLYDLYTYPTFVNIYPFTLASTEGSEADEAFRFQSIEGITCNVDLAISAHADPEKANVLFQTYRKDMVPIIKENLRQDVSNFFVDYASKLRVDELYSTRKMDMLKYAKEQLTAKAFVTGIVIDDISFKSDIRFPQEVEAAIIAKIGAIQLATQKQNEIVQAEADAKKRVAQAQGEAQSILLVAQAQAKANQLLSASITPTLVNYELSKKWNGVSPQYSGTGIFPALFK